MLVFIGTICCERFHSLPFVSLLLLFIASCKDLVSSTLLHGSVIECFTSEPFDVQHIRTNVVHEGVSEQLVRGQRFAVEGHVQFNCQARGRRKQTAFKEKRDVRESHMIFTILEKNKC